MLLDKEMQVIEWNGLDYPDSLYFTKAPIPTPDSGWVLVNTKAAGICGSDLHLILDHTKYLVPEENYPTVLGHENAGIVVATGEGVTKVKIGDRVAVEPIHSCGLFGPPCPLCEVGKYHLCKNIIHVGLPLNKRISGGFGEFPLFMKAAVL
jgi:L-gulonate 5-dehydrogenase